MSKKPLKKEENKIAQLAQYTEELNKQKSELRSQVWKFIFFLYKNLKQEDLPPNWELAPVNSNESYIALSFPGTMGKTRIRVITNDPNCYDQIEPLWKEMSGIRGMELLKRLQERKKEVKELVETFS